MPTYNEAENLPRIVAALLSLKADQLEIVVVDDNSPDGTGDIAEELSRQHPSKLHIIHRRRKLGLGTAYVAGFQLALERGADYIIEMDADFSHSPSYIPILLEAIKGCDVAVGSRYAPGGGVRGAFAKNSIAMARRRLKEAEEIDAEVVLTECNSCVHNLANAKLRKQKFKIYNTTQFINALMEEA